MAPASAGAIGRMCDLRGEHPRDERGALLQLHQTVTASGHEECSMSNTTPEHGDSNSETDDRTAGSNNADEPRRSADLDDGVDDRTDERTAAQAGGVGRTDPPVTADPPAVSETSTASDTPTFSDAPARTDSTSVNGEPTRADEQSDTADTAAYDRQQPYPEPVAAENIKRETYVPAATVGGTGAATLADDYAADSSRAPYPAYAPVQQSPIYVQAPTAPHERGNRGGGILIALVATVVFAALFAVTAFIISAVTNSSVADASTTFVEFLIRPVFYIPVIFFFIAFAVLIAIVNRGGWWSYVLFGFLVAVVVYFAYIGGALLTVQAWTFTPGEASTFIAGQWLNPGAIAAAVIAREVPIWFGAWVARRGRAVTARNAEGRAEYDRLIEAGPQLTRP